jgi:hypothetical protein
MYSYEQVATKHNLWREFVDIDGFYNEEQFENMSILEKIELIEMCFGKEQKYKEKEDE